MNEHSGHGALREKHFQLRLFKVALLLSADLITKAVFLAGAYQLNLLKNLAHCREC